MKRIIIFCILILTVSCNRVASRFEYPILDGASDIQYKENGVSYKVPTSAWLYFHLDTEVAKLLDSSEWKLLGSGSYPNGDRQALFEHRDGRIMRIRLSGIDPDPLFSGSLVEITIEDKQ